MKTVLSKLFFAEIASEVAFRCIYTLNAAQRDIECFNLQLQMQHFWHFKHKTLNTDIKNYFKNENRL